MENDKVEKKWTMKKIAKTIGMVVIIFSIWLAVVQYISADKYEAVVKVVGEEESVGVNPMTERLDFGDLPKGNGSARFVTVENNGEMDIYIKVIKFGNISEIMRLDRNNFILEAGESEKLAFHVKVPISANEGQYKGKILIFKLPKLF